MTEHALDASRVSLSVVTAPNPGPKTLSGTHTYIVSAQSTVWVVDPGPADRTHAQAVLDSVAATQATRVGGILVTHHHEDHTGAASMIRRSLSAAAGFQVPLYSADPSRVPGSVMVPNEFAVDGATVAHIIHLPGHTPDSVGLLVAGGRMLTGDTLLGGSPTSLDEDGSLHEYLQCLNILRVMCIDGRISGLFPGHGRIIDSPTEALSEIESQLEHRMSRIAQVKAARERGLLTVQSLLEDIYEPGFRSAIENGTSEADVLQLRSAAAVQIRLALDYLKSRGEA